MNKRRYESNMVSVAHHLETARDLRFQLDVLLKKAPIAEMIVVSSIFEEIIAGLASLAEAEKKAGAA